MPLRSVVLACVTLAAGSGCAAAPAAWEYPVKLGDSRERVYDLLGLPTEKIPDPPTSSMIEWFPISGVSVEFDEFHKARVLHFPGEYRLDGWVVSDRKILFGLDARSDRSQFDAILGAPAVTTTGPDAHTYTWRRDSYAILGEFWTADVQHGGKIFKAGTLKRVELSPAQ